MFTMSKVKALKDDFYLNHLSANDYYSEDEKTIGHWYGKLATSFQVSGKEVTPDEFSALQKNRCPWEGQNAKLTPGKGNDTRFFDYQCSAQKSVSIMAVVTHDTRLREIHEETVREALSELERFAAHRHRKGEYRNSNDTIITGNLLAALYTHDASRALDPQLHTHCVVANVTLAPDGRRLALSEREMCRAIRYAGKYYQATMARKVMSLGYKVRLKLKKGQIEGFEIDGLDEALLDRFSRRRAEIEEAIGLFKSRNGREPTAAEIHVMARETREKKLKEITTPEVLAQQMAMLTPDERKKLFGIKSRAMLNAQELPDPKPGEIRKLIGQAIDHLYERNSVLTAHQIMAEVLNQSMGKLDPKSVFPKLERELIKLLPGQNNLLSLYATPRGIELEKYCIKLVNDNRHCKAALGVTESLDTSRLAADQRAAVLGILQNEDFCCSLRGFAGAGKTTALQAMHQGLVAADRDVLYLAPTRGAVNVLKNDGFQNATTVADFLTKSPPLNANAVLVVDETSLVSNVIGHKILSKAMQSGARIVFVGDHRQHVSVEAGDFLRILETYSQMQTFTLSSIKRQQPEAYREAVKLMATGNAGDGLARLHELGAVEAHGAEYLIAAARRYVASYATGKNVLLVSPTHAEIDSLTEIIRKQLFPKQNGKSRIVFRDFGLTKEQLASPQSLEPGQAIRFNLPVGSIPANTVLQIDKIDGHQITFDNGQKFKAASICHAISAGELRPLNIMPGERILITANDKRNGLTNGDVATVVKIDAQGTMTLQDGRTIPSDFLNISYGYATTSHKSQGMTSGEVILAAASLDKRACYVGSSRGRQTVKIITPDYEYLLNSVKRDADRLAVCDIIKRRSNFLQ